MKYLYLIILFVAFTAKAHDIHYENVIPRAWHSKEGKLIQRGTFLLCKGDIAYIELASGSTLQLPLQQLSDRDNDYVKQATAKIAAINGLHISKDQNFDLANKRSYGFALLLFFALLLSTITIYTTLHTQRKYWAYIMGLYIFLSLTAFKIEKMVALFGSPEELDKAFIPFKPEVHTYYDQKYFYVESKGIPTTHEMMKGIIAWQQQVPIPQCYIGANAWPIPLNPVPAVNPIPVDMIHFTRGAVAIAVNGVPIFNVHTNTGVDSYIDGQLDDFGGHCGRADDYHYHIAPLHLYQYTIPSLPIAYGLDGYAVYGATEPDGSPMQPLDDNHGHSYPGSAYHYHGTKEAPYMIARMAGEVVEDDTHQLIPQAAAKGVRPALTPLKGAVITKCKANAQKNGYTLQYTLNGKTDSIVYAWTNNGKYTFNFFKDGVATTNTYNGFVQCNVPITSAVTDEKNAQTILIYPNPSKSELNIEWLNSESEASVQSMHVFDLHGKKIFQTSKLLKKIDTSNYSAGTYLISVTTKAGSITKRFVVL